jgi:hypothetical protein
MGHGAWGMGCGVWGMGHGAWGMGHGAWGVGVEQILKWKIMDRNPNQISLLIILK